VFDASQSLVERLNVGVEGIHLTVIDCGLQYLSVEICRQFPEAHSPIVRRQPAPF
jgi:riboflavin synthase alpha subunit